MVLTEGFFTRKSQLSNDGSRQSLTGTLFIGKLRLAQF